MNVTNFLSYINIEKRYSDKTLEAYRNDLFQFEEFILAETGHFNFDQITKYEIRLWVMSLVERNYSATSINRKISTLRSYVKYLKREGLLKKDPLVGMTNLKSPDKLPVFVKPAELVKLLDEVPFGEDFEGVRDRLILEMLYNTGMRVSELASLRNVQVDLTGQNIKVLGKRNKERYIPINRLLSTRINDYIVCRKGNDLGQSPYFFVTKKGDPIYVKLVYRVVTKYLSLVTTQSKKSPHVLRHTFATVLLNNGAELNVIKELLGHANLSATEVYTHSSFKDLSQAYKLAHPRA